MAVSLIEWLHGLVLAFCMIGFLSLFNHLYKFVKWIWCTFLRPPKELTSYGSWALITGCTNGIGKALAFELASKGLNLVLVGRNLHKLQSTSNEIWETFGKKTKIKIIDIDFAKISGEEIQVQVSREIEGLDVGVLVNNVGLGIEAAKFFHEANMDGMVSLVDANIGSVTWVTKAVLPGMLRRKKGAIVNIGSGSSVALPSYPLFTVYAATKAYVAMLSRSLYVEYQRHGIDIQCQIPLLVETNMASIFSGRSSFFSPSPVQYSKASIRWIGYEFLCVPYWTHALQWCIMNAFPDSLVNWFTLRYFLSLHKEILLQKESKNNACLKQKS